MRKFTTLGLIGLALALGLGFVSSTAAQRIDVPGLGRGGGGSGIGGGGGSSAGCGFNCVDSEGRPIGYRYGVGGMSGNSPSYNLKDRRQEQAALAECKARLPDYLKAPVWPSECGPKPGFISPTCRDVAGRVLYVVVRPLADPLDPNASGALQSAVEMSSRLPAIDRCMAQILNTSRPARAWLPAGGSYVCATGLQPGEYSPCKGRANNQYDTMCPGPGAAVPDNVPGIILKGAYQPTGLEYRPGVMPSACYGLNCSQGITQVAVVQSAAGVPPIDTACWKYIVYKWSASPSTTLSLVNKLIGSFKNVLSGGQPPTAVLPTTSPSAPPALPPLPGTSPPLPPVGPANQTFRIPLQAGWNMISSPAGTLPINQISGCAGLKRAYIYAPVIRDYRETGALRPGEGAWLLAPNACQAEISGPAVPPVSPVSLAAGWNMISGGTSWNQMRGDCQIIGKNLFRYSAATGAYDERPTITDTLSPFKGYWVKVASSCTPGFVSAGEPPGLPI